MWRGISKILVACQEYFLVASIVIMTVAAFLQVLYRYVLELPQTSFEEIARYLMIACAFVGFGLGIRNNEHIKLDFLETILTNHHKARQIIQIINHILVLIFSLMMTYLGYHLFIHALVTSQHSPGANLPLAWFKVTVMIGFAFSVLYSIGHLLHSFQIMKK